MFVRIDNTPRDYAWGSRTAMAEQFGREPSGAPEAELWLGAHAGSPARILNPSQADGAITLAEWIDRDPVDALGDGGGGAEAPRLTFLMKLLAAGAPLSLQAHPTSQQAQEGFAAENAAGVPLDAAERNYKDPFHKPELVVALSDGFDALCGFRPPNEAVRDLDALIRCAQNADLKTDALQRFRDRLATPTNASQVLRDAVGWLLGGSADGQVAGLITETVEAVAASDSEDDAGLRMDTIRMLAAAYPGDAGIVISLLLHRVRLARGEALYLPAGNIHSYLRGLGVEVMAASDNVLRGGLTPKHIDVDALLAVLEFAPLPVPYLRPDPIAPGIDRFRPDVPDFQLVHVRTGSAAEGDVRVALPGPGIVLCTSGSARVRGERGSILLERGDSVYITPEESAVGFDGDGELFLATTNL